jgi:hypothetical protein
VYCELPFVALKPNIYTVQFYIGTKYQVYDYYDKNFQFVIETALPEFSNLIPDASQGNLIIDQIWK